MKKPIQFVLLGIFSFLFAISFPIPPARGEIRQFKADRHLLEGRREADVSKIMLMMEGKISDKTLLEKTREKLLTLKDSELMLITSLSDRITSERKRPAAEIAFLLITALITLS